MWLKHDSGEAAEVRNQQVLGDQSPLEFGEDGYAEVDDPEAGRKLLAMHRHISPGGHGPDTADEDGDEDELPLAETDPDQLTEAQRLIDEADYRTLQEVAGEFDSVAGNQSEADLRVDLHTDVDEDDVVDAFEAVDDTDENERE